MASFATQVQIRRGTDAENDAFTGAEGEVTMDLTNKQLRVHDGQTKGGMKIPNIETVFGTNQIANNAVTEEKIADNAVTGGKIADGAITETKLSADLQTKINEKTSGAGRNIGDIFWTTRTDSALNGAVECNGGTYNTTDYAGDGSIGELLTSGKLPYVSLTDYATAISTKGWCDKIGWNGAGTTSFRVPTLTPRIIQTNNIPVIGNGMSLGITDGDTTQSFIQQAYEVVRVFKPCNYVSTPLPATGNQSTNVKNGSVVGITKDPTKSGIIADTSDTAQLRVMFQLFNGATDEAVAKCTEVLSDVAGLKQATDGMIDYVVESQDPTEANGYTWYRLYKSGWVEQGGILQEHSIPAGDGGKQTLTLPIEMADTNYTVTFGAVDGQTAYQSATISRTTTGGTVIQMNRSAGATAVIQFSYIVSGMAA